MTTELRRVLLLDATGDAAWVEAALADTDARLRCVVVACETLADLVQIFRTSSVDLVLIDLSQNLRDGLKAIRLLRNIDPVIPLVAVSASTEDDRGLLAIRAGAQDFFVRGTGTSRCLAQAISYAIERSRVFNQSETAKEHEARERELQSLRHLCGPAPLPVSGRSFGSIPLRDRSSQTFLDLARQYEQILIRLPTTRSYQDREQIADELNAIADRLGLLHAGPRDVIDLHKVAIAKRLEGQTLGRARSAIDEARMLLLQLMGYLVSFYRNLSWGAGASGRPRGSPERRLTNPGAVARKNES